MGWGVVVLAWLAPAERWCLPEDGGASSSPPGFLFTRRAEEKPRPLPPPPLNVKRHTVEPVARGQMLRLVKTCFLLPQLLGSVVGDRGA